MISSVGSSGNASDIASLLRSNPNSSTGSQRVREQRPPPPDPTEMFKNMDTDGDGAVTKTEFTTLMDKMQESQGSHPPPPGGGQPPSAKELFAKIDSDSDGQISLEELQTDFESHKPEKGRSAESSSGPDLSELFEKLDGDADGQIGETEFKKLLEVMQQSREQPAGATYTKDTSASGGSTTSLLGYA